MDWNVTEVSVTAISPCWYASKDGVEGGVIFLPTFFRGVFSQLHDPALFQQVTVVDGVVTWPGELDLAPDTMHDEIKRRGEWVLQ